MEQYPYKLSPTRAPLWRATGQFLLVIVKIILISLAIILPVRYFLIQPFYVNGESMFPNYEDNDYLIINEVSFKVFKNAPVRGEVVVFRYPQDPSKFFIKRVVGLPGETVEIANGHVKIYNADFQNGIVLDESVYLEDSVKTKTPKGDIKITLAEDEFYVLGDNRPESFDSRIFGPIHYDDIVGKTWLRGLPFERAGVFEPPLYNL